MDLNQAEIAVVEEVAAEMNASGAWELNQFSLATLGGGLGETAI